MSTEESAAKASEKEEEEEEEDLEKLQAEIERMEAEAARITKETEDLENKGGSKSSDKKSEEDESFKRDGLSVYVGQVDYATTPEELLAHFEACGTVERVTIVCDKVTGRPKGFAYIEFGSDEAVENALKLDGSTFKERQLKVTHKRVNDPNFYYGQEVGGRGRGGRGRGRGRGGRGPSFRGGRGGFRGRGRGYHPYY